MKVNYNPDAIKLLCYDVQPLIMEGIRKCTKQNTDIELIGAFDDLTKFRNSLSLFQKIDVIIIGLLSAEGSSVQLIEEIKKLKPKAILILYTIIESRFIINRLVEMGVSRVFHKRVSGQDLMNEVLEISKNRPNQIEKEKHSSIKNKSCKLD